MQSIWTAVAIVTITVALIIEVFALVTSRMTLSRFVWNTSRQWPLLPLLVGLLLGHFFWQVPCP